MFKGRQKGQSTLEYIIVFAAIVVAVLLIAYNTLKPAVIGVMNASATKITNASATFK
ncbi:MAG: class III signal peptide-containing protein [Candidatus Omnitrophota bacterium]